jgi:hypothetical protein
MSPGNHDEQLLLVLCMSSDTARTRTFQRSRYPLYEAKPPLHFTRYSWWMDP